MGDIESMNSTDRIAEMQKAVLDQAVKNCKQALVRNVNINAGKVLLSGPHSARFTGGEHEGWNKPISKKYVYKLAEG